MACRVWLIENVPAMIDIVSADPTPEATAQATTSVRPRTTGVPSARPVAAAPTAETVAATASEGRIGASLGRRRARPSRSSSGAA